MQVTVKKWGNSAAVRIPASLMTAVSLKLDEAVDVREENGRLVIEPVREGNYSLDALLSGITDDNLHGEEDAGPSVGAETW